MEISCSFHTSSVPGRRNVSGGIGCYDIGSYFSSVAAFFIMYVAHMDTIK
jgi:hypothetical protein